MLVPAAHGPSQRREVPGRGGVAAEGRASKAPRSASLPECREPSGLGQHDKGRLAEASRRASPACLPGHELSVAQMGSSGAPGPSARKVWGTCPESPPASHGRHVAFARKVWLPLPADRWGPWGAKGAAFTVYGGSDKAGIGWGSGMAPGARSPAGSTRWPPRTARRRRAAPTGSEHVLSTRGFLATHVPLSHPPAPARRTFPRPAS